MSPVGFEPIISAGERQQTYALDSAATGTGIIYLRNYYFLRMTLFHGVSYDIYK
jgi:hypothetical protein